MIASKKQNKNTNKKAIAHEKIRQFGISQIRQVASRQQPLFCHSWDGADSKFWNNKRQRTAFNTALRRAHFALFDMGLNFATGMSKQGKRLVEARKYPPALKHLREYMFVNDTKVTPKQFDRMLEEYVKAVEARAPRVIETHGGLDKALAIDWKADYQKSFLVLDRSNDGMWGSRRQWAYGETVSRLLAHYRGMDLHPVFAIMLNPTGGIAGMSNMSMLTGDMHTSVIVHAVVHDSFGYVRSFHDAGPGYNYLCVDSALAPTRIVSLFTKGDNSCYDCQVEGVLCARREMSRLGTLGDHGRIARQKDMLARRRALAKDHRESQYPDHCLPTVSEIESECQSHCNVGFFGSIYGEMKQFTLSVGLAMGYFRDEKNAAQSPVPRARRKRSAGAIQSQEHDRSSKRIRACK